MSPQLSRLRRVAYVAFFSVIVGFFVITGVKLQNLAFPEARGFLFSHGLGRHRHRSGFGQRRDDECPQFRKSRGNPLCRLSEHCLACDG